MKRPDRTPAAAAPDAPVGLGGLPATAGSQTTPAAPAWAVIGAPQPAAQAIRVRCNPRLHLGFLDPSATLGRRFGSLGLVLDGQAEGGLATELQAQWALDARGALPAVGAQADEVAAAPGVPAEETERVAQALARLRAALAEARALPPLQLWLAQSLPPHAGFGSGTQLALAVGVAVMRLAGRAAPTAALAQMLGRGLRSGIGIAAFDRGGLLLDAGPSPDGQPAPVVAQLDCPSHWRAVLLMDPSRTGLAGALERAAIAALPPQPREVAADLCHQVLMRVLPGAACGDFEAFGRGVTALQDAAGQHFAPAQGGSPWTSPAVGRVLDWARAESESVACPWHAAGLGQSSWGPTGFVLVPSAAVADALLAQARRAAVLAPELQCAVLAPSAGGARIGVVPRRSFE